MLSNVADQDLAAHPARNEAALSALGGAMSFLRSVLLDRAVLPLGRISALPCAQSSEGCSTALLQEYMRIDGSTLDNLEVQALPKFLHMR